MMAPKDLTKNACIAFQQTAGDWNKMYSKHKSSIEASLPWSPKVYAGALAVCYGALSLPTLYTKKLFGSIGGGALNWLYVGGVMGPLRSLVSLFDFRVIKGMFATVYYVTKNCLPLAIKKTLDYLIKSLSEFFFTVEKAVKGLAKVKNLQSRQMLTESKSMLMEGRIWDWFKNKMYSIASKFKDAAWYMVKKGWSVVEKPFMAVLYPLSQCLAKNNKLHGLLSSSSLSSGLAGKLVAKLGLGATISGVAGTAVLGTTVGIALSSILSFMAVLSTVFFIATMMNMFGGMVEFKNMISDVFS